MPNYRLHPPYQYHVYTIRRPSTHEDVDIRTSRLRCSVVTTIFAVQISRAEAAWALNAARKASDVTITKRIY